MSPIALDATVHDPITAINGLKARLTRPVTVDQPRTSGFDPSVDQPFNEVNDDGSYKVLDQPLGMRRKLRVVCLGGGASGINMA